MSDEEGGSAAELSCISRSTLTATAAARALSRLSGDVESDASGSVRLGPRNLPTTQTPAYKTISNAKAVLTPMAVRPNPSCSVAGSTPNVKVLSLLARNNGFDCTTNIHAGHRHPAYRYSFHARVAWGRLLYVDTFRHLEAGGCVGGGVLHPSSFGVGPWFLRSVVCWLWSNAVVEGSSLNGRSRERRPLHDSIDYLTPTRTIRRVYFALL